MSCCGHKPSKVKMRPRFKHLKPKATLAAQQAPQKTFLMCRPTHYGIDYAINPWMSLTNPADRRRATEQWNDLHDRIVEHGGAVRYIKEQPGLPDMVFTANGATVLKDKATAVIANFRHPERKGEEEWFVQWFAEAGWNFIYPAAAYEGAGDALPLNGTLVCGTGFRSTAEAHAEVEQFWGGPALVVKLVDPRFYHLDTCFCPLSGGDFLIHSAAFDTDSFHAIERLQRAAPGSHGIGVPADEAARFACNAVCVGRAVILPAGCPVTMQLLEQRGYTPVPVEMSEFIKAGGACKCLTLEV